MECLVCGKEFDILYSCPECKSGAGYCKDHRYDHVHVKPDPKPSPDPQIITTGGGKTITNENIWRRVENSWTSGKEWMDLIIGSLVITFAIGFDIFIGFDGLPTLDDLSGLIIVSVIISISFITHEMSHKYMAISHQHDSRFVLNVVYISISIVLALAGWSFILVGAAMVIPKRGITMQEEGLISGAGPFSNLILGTISFIMAQVLGNLGVTVLVLNYNLIYILFLSTSINGFLGAFNMIPFGFFDGRKIMSWNKIIWVFLLLGNFLLYLAGVGF